MTPKEKSQEIFNSHYTSIIEYGEDLGQEILVSILAIKASIITVNQVIEQWENIDVYLCDLNGTLSPNLKYWYEVLKEIKKL